MLTDKEIRHIADLARITLTPEKEGIYRKELSAVLRYVEQLDGIDASGVEPLYQTTGLMNALRADTHRNVFADDRKLGDFLVRQAPEREGSYVKVKAVMNRSHE